MSMFDEPHKMCLAAIVAKMKPLIEINRDVRLTRQNTNNAICWKKHLMSLDSVCLLLVHCIYRWAELPADGSTTVFYVFGSEAIYIVDPENKAVQSTIEADGVCTPRR